VSRERSSTEVDHRKPKRLRFAGRLYDLLLIIQMAIWIYQQFGDR